MGKSFKDIAKIVSSVAPLLGSLLGGPVGGAVGAAVKLVANALGVEEDPEAIYKALETDPEALMRLRELEMRHKETLEHLLLEAERARLADVASAREREVEITRVLGRRDINLYVLAWVVTGGFFTLCYALMRIPLPEGSNDVVFMLFGALAAGFGQVLQYFFGSSRGSSEKNVLFALKGKESSK